MRPPDSPPLGSDPGPDLETPREEPPPRPFAELRETGLLWLLNRVALHPRGFALALDLDADGHAIGWTLEGDGTEPWSYGDMPDGTPMDDVGFERVEAFLASARRAPGDR